MFEYSSSNSKKDTHSDDAFSTPKLTWFEKLGSCSQTNFLTFKSPKSNSLIFLVKSSSFVYTITNSLTLVFCSWQINPQNL